MEADTVCTTSAGKRCRQVGLPLVSQKGFVPVHELPHEAQFCVVPVGALQARSGSLRLGQKPALQVTEQVPALQLAEATLVWLESPPQ